VCWDGAGLQPLYSYLAIVTQGDALGWDSVAPLALGIAWLLRFGRALGVWWAPGSNYKLTKEELVVVALGVFCGYRGEIAEQAIGFFVGASGEV
jgi:hypothetical protein